MIVIDRIQAFRDSLEQGQISAFFVDRRETPLGPVDSDLLHVLVPMSAATRDALMADIAIAAESLNQDL